jgi:hypothetical protein
MKLSVYAIAILAAVSTSAVAQGLKQDQNAPAPALKATQMTDSEMDKVTAGDVGQGVITASAAGGQPPTACLNPPCFNITPLPPLAGVGTITAEHAPLKHSPF